MNAELESAADQGRICALSMTCLRDLQECCSAYPTLFPAKPMGPTVYSGVALANAFGSPWAAADQIRIAARTSMWVFAADWLVDYIAKSRDEIDVLVQGCAAVGEGAAPAEDVPLQGFLAGLRDELAAGPGWAQLGPVWRDHLQRYLLASAREWEWKSAHACGDLAGLPTFEEYLANADNYGSSLVNISHWIHNESVRTPDQLERLAVVSAEVQRVLRLLNDLVTYERDVTWGDLNGLMLGITRTEVSQRIGELVENCRKLIEPLTDSLPREASYLERQIGFSTGYYGMTDYWGSL
ncbi:MAG TPA: terpene synthase family protein [Streptosporangiaceae bacterium]|jgi:hypothetical protein|nr:terpene synthase family protein [Streptosporangiaceae bacterium]